MAPDEQTHRDLDAPQPPGSPMRQDAPDADVTPGRPTATTSPDPGPDPEVRPSGNPDGPQVAPSPDTPPGEPGPDPEPATEPTETGAHPPTQAQVENAESSLDEPSDNSGAE
jgi:hypothetical protein